MEENKNDANAVEDSPLRNNYGTNNDAESSERLINRPSVFSPHVQEYVIIYS